MKPRISVVMPTHNRADILRLTLEALARQTVPASDYELVLVADGCTDGTAELVRQMHLPYALRYLEQPARGAGPARNQGASAATAPLLLFLDDDKEAAPNLIEAHLNAHRTSPGSVVLGYYPIPAHLGAVDPFARAAKEWWDDAFSQRAQPAYRFTFKDFCSGNVSLSAELFRLAGGFDERIPGAGGEDYELGVRLLARGAAFRFVREALSLHHEVATLGTVLRRARAEGYAHVRIVERHPALFRSFKLHVLSRLERFPLIWGLVWDFPLFADGAALLIRPLVGASRALRAERTLWRMVNMLLGHAYWKGVREAIGAHAEWTRFCRLGETTAPSGRDVDLDLATDLDRLDEMFEREWADSVTVYWRGALLGHIEPVPGAERLSGRHVRDLLATKFSGPLLGVLVDRQFRSGAVPPDRHEAHGDSVFETLA